MPRRDNRVRVQYISQQVRPLLRFLESQCSILHCFPLPLLLLAEACRSACPPWAPPIDSCSTGGRIGHPIGSLHIQTAADPGSDIRVPVTSHHQAFVGTSPEGTKVIGNASRGQDKEFEHGSSFDSCWSHSFTNLCKHKPSRGL